MAQHILQPDDPQARPPLAITRLVLLALFGSAILLAALLAVGSTGDLQRLRELAAYQTQCSVGTAGVLAQRPMIWDMYGTPTPTPSRTPYVTAQPTATAYDAYGTVVAVLPTSDVVAPTLTPRPHQLGEAARGQAIFYSQGKCAVCHGVTADSDTGAGPSLAHIGTVGETRVTGMRIEDYLRESIVEPDYYLVPGYLKSVMPVNYASTLFPQQVDDLIAYLLTLR